ncbi:MAG TPA: nicotinate-nucleotide adenylyltransferase [Ignavibacteria bacterium]|nr:nicotinate (nicotinamide) nucleotide adenylyltransferase [Bacteroidota bacterium]HRI84215.1 nicotinate-nucleotide adenylyltransferase [Ignavibacteria bacterium]HRJ99520.1 nicotinate-nucleotide adenylyltransferase [Ignavibacteria bacterium]HRK00108.1 nicotinate-nucleotide adenylyltransferase [Ignavibacteria bacterium]
MKRIGIFGGAFNPPHIAHSIAAQHVTDELKLDKMIFIPSGNHPLKESISSEHRLAMAKLAFGNNGKFEVSDIEIRDSGEKTYTVETLQKLKEVYINENVKFFLILGADNILILDKWKQPEKLFELAEIIVVGRPGSELEKAESKYSSRIRIVPIPLMEISSSKIRTLIREKKSVRYMISSEVEKYIYVNRLYI